EPDIAAAVLPHEGVGISKCPALRAVGEIQAVEKGSEVDGNGGKAAAPVGGEADVLAGNVVVGGQELHDRADELGAIGPDVCREDVGEGVDVRGRVGPEGEPGGPALDTGGPDRLRECEIRGLTHGERPGNDDGAGAGEEFGVAGDGDEVCDGVSGSVCQARYVYGAGPQPRRSKDQDPGSK